MQHIHYGDWTIEWCDSDYGYYFAIASGLYRMDWRAVEPLCLEVGSFDTTEYGVIASKRLINEIIERQKNAAIRAVEEYIKANSGYTAEIDRAPQPEVENEDGISF